MHAMSMVSPLSPLQQFSEMLSRGRISPREAAEQALARANSNASHNVYIALDAEKVREQADALPQRFPDSPKPLLYGVPVSIKDCFDVAGFPTTLGSCFYADRNGVAREDSAVAARLRSQGAIVIGKTHMHPLAYGITGENPDYGDCAQPRDPQRLTGGSSSGGTASVQERSALAAIGTDTGGSVRGPAAFCGIAGLKPTYGRVSRRGVFPNTFTMDHCGPLTRSAEDIALFLQVIAGFDAEDPGSEDVAVPNYAAGLMRPIEGLRLGLIEHWYAHGAHPDLPPAMSAAVEVLHGLGAVVEPVQLSSLRDYTDCKTTISIAELYAIHEKDLKTRPQDFGRILRNRVLPGALIRAEDYVQALRWRTVLAREQAAALKRFDALLTAGALGVADRADPRPDRLVSVPSITMPFSVGGLPALAIPCGFSRVEGLPLSLQIAAAPMAEPTVLRIAYAYQQATDWHSRHPDLH